MKNILLSALSVLLLQKLNAQIVLDNLFSGDGKANISVGLYDDYTAGGVLQADGKILVSANTYDDAYQYNMPVMVRYNADGSLDNTFYSSGSHAYDLQLLGHEYAYRPLLLPDGKILLPFSKPAGFWGFTLLRLNADGRVDSSFGINGIARNEAQRTPREVGCAIQQDGKIILAGSIDNMFPSTGTGFFVARFLADGSVDSTFNGTGYMENDLNSSPGSYFRDIILDNSGNIYLIGISIQTINKGIVMSVNPTGTLNNTFNGSGILYYDHSGMYTTFQSCIIYDNDLLIAGNTHYGNNDSLMGLLVRLNFNGSFDNTLNGSGIKEIDTDIFDLTYGIAEDANGKVVLGGSSGPSFLTEQFTVYRLHADGSFDNSINGNGMFRSSWGSVANLNNVLIQPDGKIVGVAAVSGITNSYYEIGVVRIIPAGGGSSAITQKIPDDSFLVYPNPATDILKIKMPAPGLIKIMDPSGKVILQSESAFKDEIHPLDIANLPQGIYGVAIVTNQGAYLQKLIKK